MFYPFWIRRLILLGSFALVAVNGRAADSESLFPGSPWQTKSPGEVGLESDKLSEFAKAIGGDGVVIRDGYLVKAWGRSDRRADWASSAKPVISTLVLFAVREGKLKSVDDPVRPWVQKRWPGKDLVEKDRSMTFRHLADMASGYSRAEEPGTHWAYNDLAINLYRQAVKLAVELTADTEYTIEWWNPTNARDGSFHDATALGGGTQVLVAPAVGDWAVRITKRKTRR